MTPRDPCTKRPRGTTTRIASGRTARVVSALARGALPAAAMFLVVLVVWHLYAAGLQPGSMAANFAFAAASGE